jgi:hypothetical protein
VEGQRKDAKTEDCPRHTYGGGLGKRQKGNHFFCENSSSTFSGGATACGKRAQSAVQQTSSSFLTQIKDVPLLLERIARKSLVLLVSSVYTETERQIMQQLWQLLRWPSEIPFTPPPTTKRERDETETKHARNNQSFLYSDRSNHVPVCLFFFPNARGYFKMLVTLFAQDGNEPTG